MRQRQRYRNHKDNRPSASDIGLSSGQRPSKTKRYKSAENPIDSAPPYHGPVPKLELPLEACDQDTLSNFDPLNVSHAEPTDSFKTNYIDSFGTSFQTDLGPCGSPRADSPGFSPHHVGGTFDSSAYSFSDTSNISSQVKTHLNEENLKLVPAHPYIVQTTPPVTYQIAAVAIKSCREGFKPVLAVLGYGAFYSLASIGLIQSLGLRQKVRPVSPGTPAILGPDGYVQPKYYIELRLWSHDPFIRENTFFIVVCEGKPCCSQPDADLFLAMPTSAPARHGRRLDDSSTLMAANELLPFPPQTTFAVSAAGSQGVPNPEGPNDGYLHRGKRRKTDQHPNTVSGGPCHLRIGGPTWAVRTRLVSGFYGGDLAPSSGPSLRAKGRIPQLGSPHAGSHYSPISPVQTVNESFADLANAQQYVNNEIPQPNSSEYSIPPPPPPPLLLPPSDGYI